MAPLGAVLTPVPIYMERESWISMGWIDRQLPQDDEIFLDHVGYFAADLDAAGQRLHRLGFRVSDVNVQYNEGEDGRLVVTGTSNRLVLLERGFIEVLAATADTPLADQLREALTRHVGLHVVALTHPGMVAQRKRLMAGGIAMQDVVELRRRVDTPQGERQMAYSVLRTRPGEMAEGRVQMLTNHTPELLWTEGSTDHANRVDALTDLLICVDDADEALSRFGLFAGRAAARGNGMAVVDLDRGRLTLADRDQMARILGTAPRSEFPHVAGMALRSADLEAARDVLDSGGTDPLYADDEIVCVGPDDALGAYLVFHTASADQPWRRLAAAIGE